MQVERAERLVEQEHARPVDDRARKRDALALAAGQLRRAPVLVLAEADHPQRLATRPARSSFGDLLDAQAVADVLADGHVREERVVLEHGVDVARVRAAGA